MLEMECVLNWRESLFLKFGTIGNATANGHVEHKMKKKFSLLEKDVCFESVHIL